MKKISTQNSVQLQNWRNSVFAILTFLLWGNYTIVNAQIIDDGNLHSVGYNGSYQDFQIPMNPSIYKITFNLTGGDGGYARVNSTEFDLDCFCEVGFNVRANGGAGASASATFQVGNGPGKIPHGSIIRFVIGGRGQNGSSTASVGVGFDYGGGGGGTGILVKAPSEANFSILAVAGGGSGAYQGLVFNSSVDKEHGQGGLAGTSGGSGNGDLGSGAGGSNGNGGGSNPSLGSFGGGGGGAFSAGGGVDCVGIDDFNTSQAGEGGPGNNGGSFTGGYGGDSDNCFNFTWRNGGFGFGGGGAGSGAGGGGGGYSGGGVGGTTGRGGGGGSYLASIRESGSTAAGGSTSNPGHGFASYQITLNAPPTVVCKAATIYLNASGKASIIPADITQSANDPEGGTLEYAISKSDFDCSNVGVNVVTLTVTDNIGLSGTCLANVTVVDDIDPTVKTKDITVYLNASGSASITPAMINDGSTDNCTIQTYSLDKLNFNCSNVGNNTVMLTVTDVSGNSATKTATVTVNDNMAPTVITQNVTIQLDAMGMASITTTMINNGSTDNCAIQTYSLDKMNFNCTNVGDNTVILTVTDVNGNSATNTATVTVKDNIAPTINSTTPTPAVLWPPNHKMVPVSININSFDNCAGSTCKIISVSSNEPLNSKGDGNTEIDWMITGAFGVDLRAERSGNLSGRIYTITMECTDASGNKTRSTTTVSVPHNGPNGRVSAEEPEMDNGLSIKVLENPSESNAPFILIIESDNANTPIDLRLLNATGKLNEQKNGLKAGTKVEIGKNTIAGLYFAEVIQNGNKKIIKLLKR